MKLCIEFAVEGAVELAGPIDITLGEWEYRFIPDDNGRLGRIALITRVARPEQFVSTFQHPIETAPAVVSVKMDEDLVDAAQRRIQALESHMAFRLPVARIRWDSARYEFIFDNDQERKAQGVYSIQVDYASAERPSQRATRIDFGRSIVASERFASLTIPLAFVREGNNEFYGFRYINSFHSYYFVLEGLYGDGHWRNYRVAEAFARSSNFNDAVAAARDEIEAQDPEIYRQLKAEIAPSSDWIDSIATAKFLIDTRGRLHHFANSARNDGPTPFSHDKVKPATYLVRAVALFSIAAEMRDIIKQEGAAHPAPVENI